MELQLPAVLKANEEYRRTQVEPAGLDRVPSRRLVVLTCMDTRLDLFRALGLELGEAQILRNAGGRVSADVIRSLVVSAHLLGTREVGVLHHTDCGVHATDEELARKTGAHDLEFLSFDDLRESVREDLTLIRSCALLPDGVVAWGAIYDVETSALEVVDDGRSPYEST